MIYLYYLCWRLQLQKTAMFMFNSLMQKFTYHILGVESALGINVAKKMKKNGMMPPAMLKRKIGWSGVSVSTLHFNMNGIVTSPARSIFPPKNLVILILILIPEKKCQYSFFVRNWHHNSREYSQDKKLK